MANTFKFGNGNWATKEDSVLAYNDENNNFKPLPFDFTRASTATYVDSDGLIKTAKQGEARIDYTDNTDGHLLLEPSRTNLITYSEDFTNASWAKQNSGTGTAPVVTSDNTISPDGTQNADKIVFDKGSGSSTSDLSILSASFTSQSNTASFYIKSDSEQRIVVRNSGTWVGYDVTTEWTRIEKTDTGGSIQIGLRDGYGVSNVPDTATVYLWGAQVEAGSYATSYIPTEGSAVTRLADATIASLPSSSIGQSEGVLYFEGSYLDTSEQGYIELSDGGNANRIIVWNINSTSLRGLVKVGNVTQAQINGGSISSNTIFKFAFKYKTNDFALWVNGVEIGVDTNGSTFGSNVLNQLDLQVSSVVFKGEIKDLKLYNTALTDAELETLTT